MDKIVDGLYLGDIQGASNLFMLKRLQFKYKVVNVLDMPYENLSKYFQSCINFIKNAINTGGRVLVHCYAGVSRSASVVIAYLMHETGMQMYNAMSFVRQRRPIIFPNPGFQKQLMDFERQLKVFKGQSPQKQETPLKTTEKQHSESKGKYMSQSADKGGGKHQEEQKQLKSEELQQIYNRANLLSAQKQERAHTSQGPLRRSQHHESSVKNELLNRLNKNFMNGGVHTIESYMKQLQQQPSRAKSSYGQKNQRNAYDPLAPTLSQQFNKSIEPNLAYVNERQLSQSKLQSSTNTVSQSLYNSINNRQSKDQMVLNSYQDFKNEKNLIIADSSTNLQYSCGLCAMPLFTSRDIFDHNLGMVSSTQRGKSSQHQHKFSVNSGQIFGKTFSEMSQSMTSSRCGSLFIKRKDWINEQDGSTGNILCPRKSCAVKIGSYCWQGSRCSTCGQFVTPSFQIFRNRVAYRPTNDDYASFTNLEIPQKTVHGSFKMTQSPDITKKSVKDNNNVSFSEAKKDYNAQQIKKQYSAMENLLKQQKQILVSSNMTNTKQQQQQQSQNSKSKQKPQTSPQKFHSKTNSGQALSKANMNNLYHQLMVEQNKRLLGQQMMINSMSPSKQKK